MKDSKSWFLYCYRQQVLLRDILRNARARRKDAGLNHTKRTRVFFVEHITYGGHTRRVLPNRGRMSLGSVCMVCPQDGTN